MKESDLVKRILIRFSHGAVRLFRNQNGQAWMGNRLVWNDDGTLTIHDPRAVKFGLGPGTGDLIGWRAVLITQDMVGQKLPQFTSVECKALRGARRDDQINWDTLLKIYNCRSGFASSEEEAAVILGDVK